VISVQPGSPAAAASLRPGDRVLSLAGLPTPRIDALHRSLADRRIGERPPLDVIRAEERLVLQVVPQEPSREAT
jgi:S1-C subfamily serine protease